MSFFSPVNQARWARFRHNRRGYWSLWLFLILFLCSLGRRAAGQRPPAAGAVPGPAVRPGVKNYTEQTFGGAFATAADYQDPPAAAAAGDSRLGAMAASTLRRDDN